MDFVKTFKQIRGTSRFLQSHWKLFLFIAMIFFGFALVVLGSFNLQGRALMSVLILGGLLIGFAAIRMTYDSIKKSAVEGEKGKEAMEEFEQIKKENRNLKQELKESYQNPLKILDIQPILDMGILEVDFELAKFFDQQYTKDLEKISPGQEGSKYRFIGGLAAKFTARYGIDLLTIKVREDPENRRFYISGANPVFQGIRDFPDIHWEGSVILGKNWMGEWATDQANERVGSDCKEEFRERFQKRLKSGPEELDYLKKPLREYIRRLMQGIFAPRGYSVELVDDDTGKNFLSLHKYLTSQDRRDIQSPGREKRESTLAIESQSSKPAKIVKSRRQRR